MRPSVSPYGEHTEELREILVENGSLALLLIDISQLAQVEHDYGSGAFEKVLTAAGDLIGELRGSEVRGSDILTVTDRGGDAFLLFLSPRRYGDSTQVADLQAAAGRVEEGLNRKLARLTSPYLRGRQKVSVGFSLVFFNPLVMPDRLLARLVEEAWECVRVQKMQRDFQNRCRLQEILLQDQLRVVFQPVVDLRSGGTVGYEALARGPAGSAHQMPANLFEIASEADMVFELDRSCRKRALAAARAMPLGAKLFVNVFPSCMYDPEFQGAKLIRLLEGLGLSPERIVLEINEKYAIENYTLFVEALQNLTRVGFEIAIDDIGAGYSGLEKIAHLNPRYLKLDMQLVKDIDSSYIRREMARAFKSFADKMDATIIAEGIEREEELRTLVELGVAWGQGFLLGRPADGFGISGPRAAVFSEVGAQAAATL